jgi:hypothetical protein
MKKNISIVLFSGLLVALAIRAFGMEPTALDGRERILMRFAYMLLALLSLVTAVALWRGSARAMLTFACWVLVYLGVGGLRQFLIDGTGAAEVAVWWGVVATVLALVGLHLRHVLRTAHRQHPTEAATQQSA